MYIAVYIAVKRVYKKGGGVLPKLNYTNFWTCTKKNGLGIRIGFQMYFIFKIQGKDTSPIYLHSHVFASGYGLQRIFFQIKAFPLRKYTDIKRNARAHGFGITNILSLIFFYFSLKWNDVQHSIIFTWNGVTLKQQ